jgi:hypothetical protein
LGPLLRFIADTGYSRLELPRRIRAARNPVAQILRGKKRWIYIDACHVARPDRDRQGDYAQGTLLKG